MSRHNPNPAKSDEFVQLLAKYQLPLYTFIVALVARPDDAEDIRQNTNLVLCKKSDELPGIENFHAWARKIAYLEVLKYRRAQGSKREVLSNEVVELLADMAVERSDLLDERRSALRYCIKKLVPLDLELLAARYRDGLSLKAIAEKLGRSASSVRHSMSRVRRRLKHCVDLRVSAGEHP